MIEDIFKYLKTKPKFKTYKDITVQDIKDAIKVCSVKVWCDCGSQWWQGFAYYLTMFDASLYPCDIEPKRWGKPHNHGDSLVCKHLSLILNSISFYIPIMSGMIYKYLQKK